MLLRWAAAIVVLCIGGAPAWSACNPPGASGFPAGSTRLETQTKDSVSLTGGCIDGVPIGQNAPAAGTFTNFSLPGGAITLSGNLVTGGALATTGTGPTTLAFPSSTATYTYPAATATLMDNAAGNASLPTTRTNLGLGTASTPTFAGQFLTATEPTMTAFVPPGFGGSWGAGSIFSSIGTTAHIGQSRSTVNINRTTIGSGQNGPDSSDVALFVTLGKTDWLTSTVDGEIDAIYVQSSQGMHGDGGVLMGGAFKVRGGTGSIVPIEISTRWVNSAGNHFMDTHSAIGFAPGTGDISNNTAHGYFAGNYGPSQALAASKVDPYSAFTSMDRDIYGTCPTNCSFWQNFLTATSTVNDPETIFFQAKAGPTLAGDIMQGAGAASYQGVATQSLGNRFTTKNVGGEWRLYADDGTTVFKQTLQSISGNGVSDRLNGPNPTSLWRDTGVGLTVGGLHRLTFSGGVGYWQTNTAAGGDFSSAAMPYSISTAGVMTLNSPTLVSPLLDRATLVGTSGIIATDRILSVAYGTVGTPLPTDPTSGGSAVSSTVYATPGTGLADAITVATQGDTHLTAGSRGIAVGGVFRGYTSGTWNHASSFNAGSVGIWAEGNSSRGGVVHGGFFGSYADTTTIVGGGAVGVEIDMAIAVSTPAKFGIAILSATGDTGAVTSSSTVAGSGASVLRSAGLYIEAPIIGTTGFKYGLLTVDSGAEQPIQAAGSLWRSGGYTVANGLDWPDMTFSGNAITTPGFSVDGSGNVTGNAYKIGANLLVSSDGAYNYFSSTNGANVMLFGGAADPTNYYDRATHKFRGPGGTGAPHLGVFQTTAPALTSCGTGSPAIVGTDIAGKVTMGTSATGCVITFNVAYAAEPHCVVTWRATPLASQSYSVAAGAITLTQTSASGNVVNYVCIGT